MHLDWRFTSCVCILLFFFDACVSAFKRQYALFSGSRALFTGPTSTLLKKKKVRTIHTFKNYCSTVFLIFNF